MAKGDKRQQTMNEYNAKLKRITDHLNAIYEEAEPLRKEYYKIMAYFRTMKSRGIISEEEYQEKVAMFKYLGKYTTRTNTKQPKEEINIEYNEGELEL